MFTYLETPPTKAGISNMVTFIKNCSQFLPETVTLLNFPGKTLIIKFVEGEPTIAEGSETTFQELFQSHCFTEWAFKQVMENLNAAGKRAYKEGKAPFTGFLHPDTFDLFPYRVDRTEIREQTIEKLKAMEVIRKMFDKTEEEGAF